MGRKKTYLISILLTLYCLTNATKAFSQETDRNESIGSHSSFAHLSEKNKTYFLKMHPDSIKLSDSTYSKINYPGNFKLKKDISVFGWHVSWMGNSYYHYNYSLLTHIAYFGCDIDPTGGIRSFNGWDTSDFVSYVKSQNPQCKVLLTATCFGKSIDTLLRNESSQASLIRKLNDAITRKKADGICIDFEGISSADKEKFSSFITNLKLNFKQQNLMVCLTLPPIDSNRVFDFSILSKSVDLYILMGYGYFGRSSNYSGPVAPLTGKSGWINCNLGASVDYYLNNNVSPSSLLLAVPYFGAIWETKDSGIPSLTTKFVGYRPYNYDLGMLKYFHNDTSLKASYYCKETDNTYRQFWFDGVYSLGEKYDFILQKKLAGVGIWALGFDSGSHDLWNLLQTKFSTGNPNSAHSADSKTIGLAQNFFLFITTHIILSVIAIFLILAILVFVLLKIISSQ